MIEMLLLEHCAEDAEFIVVILQHISPDVHVEWVRDGRLITDFIFCTGEYSARTPQQLPRIILLDMTNSEIGVELIRTIKAYVRTCVVPVVLLISPDSDSADFRGADLCIVKTANRQQFAHDVALIGRYWLNNVPIGLSQTEQIRHNDDYAALSESDPTVPPAHPSTLMDAASNAFTSQPN